MSRQWLAPGDGYGSYSRIRDKRQNAFENNLIVAGVANFAEDWFGVSSVGDLFVLSGLSLMLGLLIAGVSAIRAPDISKWTGGLLIACAIGIGIPDSGGEFLVGFSLILLAFADQPSSES